MLHSKVDNWSLSANIRLGWKGLQGTNTLAYYHAALITTFTRLAVREPGRPQVIFFELKQKLKMIQFLSEKN